MNIPLEALPFPGVAAAAITRTWTLAERRRSVFSLSEPDIGTRRG